MRRFLRAAVAAVICIGLGLSGAIDAVQITRQWEGQPAPATYSTHIAHAATVRYKAPNPPQAVDYGSLVNQYDTFGNTTIGDCSVAAEGQLVQTWSGIAGTADATVSADVGNAWSALGAPTAGLSPATAFAYWRMHPIAGITADRVRYLGSGVLAPATVERDVWELGGLYAAVEVPQTALSLFASDPGATWTLSNAAASSGTPTYQHALAVVGYAPQGVIVASWGQTFTVTWQWWEVYAEDVWAILPSIYAAMGHGPATSLATIERTIFR